MKISGHQHFVPAVSVLLLILLLPTMLAAQTGLIRPQKGTVYASLLEGLKLLAAGDVDGWVSGYCDGMRLCKSDAEMKIIREYRAKLQQEIAPACLKDGERAIFVERIIGNPEVDTAVKIYLRCEEDGPPRFYSLRKTADYWFFISL